MAGRAVRARSYDFGVVRARTLTGIRAVARVSATTAVIAAFLALVPPAGVPVAEAAGECPAGWTFEPGTGTCFGSFAAAGATSWTPPAGVTSIDYFVVGGGAGGGSGNTSFTWNGGRGGTVTTGTASITSSAITITVGAGGNASANGNPSSLVQGGTTLATAAGGTTNFRAGSGVGTGTVSTFSGTSDTYGASGGATGNNGGTRAGNGAPSGDCFSGGGHATAGYGGGGGAGGGGSCFSSNWYTVAGAGGSGVVMIRYTAFAVSSFTTAVSSRTNSPSLSYSLQFTGTVDASTLTAADFSNAGNAPNCVFSVSPSAGTSATFTVTVSGCGEGTVTPTLASGSVTASTGTVGPGAASAGSTVTVDTTPPSAPGAPDLAAASDSGSSSGDDVTSDTTPAFSVSGGSTGDTATITASNGSTTKSCTYVIGTGTSCDLPALTDGTWSVSGTLTDQAGNTSSAGPATSLSVDTTAPTAPSAPDLVAASDTGSSDTDNTTSDTTPAMSLPGATAGDTVEFTATNGATTKTCNYVAGSASSCDLPTLTAGSWSVTAKVTDPAGNTSTAGPALPLTVDTTAPSAPGTPDLSAVSDTGSSSTDNVTADTTPNVSASGGSAGDTMTISATKGASTESCSYVVGSATSCDLPALTDGSWTLTSRLTDPAGNQSAASSGLPLSVDSTATSAPGAPDLASGSDTGTSNSDNVTSDTSPTFSVPGGSSGDTATVTATNGATTKTCSYTVGSASSCDLSGLTDGSWSVSGTLTDPAGNTSAAGSSTPMTLDTAAPAAPAAPDLAASSDTGSSSSDNVTSDTSPTFSVPGGSSGDTATVTATNGATTKTCSYTVGSASSCDLSGLTDGSWSVSGTLTDPAGNISATGSSMSMSVDTSAPSAPAAPDLLAASDLGSSSTDNLTSDTTPSVSGSGGSAGDTMTVTATKGATTQSCTYVVGSATSCDLPGLTDGTWALTGTLTDPAGNTSTAGTGLNVTIDGTGPVATSGPDVAAASDSGPSSTDNITSDTTPTVSVGGGSGGDVATLTATNGSTSLSCSYFVGSATSCDLPALTDGTWTLSGSITDAAGNVTVAPPSVPLTVDTTQPAPGTPDLDAASDTGSSSTDNLTNDTTPAVSVPGLSNGDQVTMSATNGSTTKTCTYTVGSAASCDLPALTDGTWTLSASVTDAAGNTGATTGTASLVVDTSAPAAPGAADLVAASDSGTSSTDDATSDSTPAVSVPGGTAGDTATLTATNGSTTRTCSYVVGAATSCDLPALTDGTWSVSGTLTDPAGNTSAAGPSTNMTVDATAPVLPARPDLSASSDTGTSSTDDVTADSTPFIEVPGVETGASVVVTATKGGVTSSCTYVAAPGTQGCWLPELADGTWSVTATATDTRGNTATTAQPLDLRIDTSRPFDGTANITGTTDSGGKKGGSSAPKSTTTVPKGGKPTATTVPVTVPKSPPGTPDLRTASDTGADPADNLTSDRTPLVGIEGLSAGDSVTLTARKDGRAVKCTYVVGDSDGCELPELTDGTWTVSAGVVDLAGNAAAAPDTLDIEVDSAAPAEVLTVSSTDDPADGRMDMRVAGPGDGALVTITATDGTTTVTCTYVAAPETTGCALEGVTPGNWSVVATSADSAGNTGADSSPYTFARTAAPAPVVPEDDADGANGAAPGGGQSGQVPTEETIRLLASMLALLAIRRRSDNGPTRLGEEDRDSSGVAEFAAGSGSGGLDERTDAYRPPRWDRLDDWMCAAAARVARLSPVFGRAMDDGSYLRALAGIFWLAMPVTGAALGVAAAASTDSVVSLPALGLFVALLVVGTLDAFAGLVAAGAYLVTVLLGGGMDSTDALRGFLGLAAPMFLVGLVASAMRPYRRASVDDHVWNRCVDFVLIPLIGAWAAGAMFSAVPHLSGYDVAWSGRVGTVELATLLVLSGRYVLENTARMLVSVRLARIENESFPEPVDGQRPFSRIVRTAVFAFVAWVFIGGNWWLGAGTAMFLLPKIVETRTDSFPNLPTVHRFVPRNLVRIVAMLFVMLWWGLLVDGAVDANEIQWAFVLMGIPGLALGVVDWFAREGDEWPSTFLSRVLGVATLAVGVALVRGWLP